MQTLISKTQLPLKTKINLIHISQYPIIEKLRLLKENDSTLELYVQLTQLYRDIGSVCTNNFLMGYLEYKNITFNELLNLRRPF